MDEKSLITLEYKKILQKVSEYSAFPVSKELALLVKPTIDLHEAKILQRQTREALQLLHTSNEISIGGVRDIRQSIDLACHGSVLTAVEINNIKYTLSASRSLARAFEKINTQTPTLWEIASNIQPIPGLIDNISRTISDHGEILDTASVKLSNIRRDLTITRERLLAKMQRMISDPNISRYLQENLVTQREGRYVIPLRSDFKGRIKSIIHDQSASGATLFVEPIGVVELNNQNRELIIAEKDEEHRILAELSNQVADHEQELTLNLNIIAELDLIFSRAKYAYDISATEPDLKPFPNDGNANLRHPGSSISLYQARHPLLDPNIVVPIDVELDPNTYALVITGPNTGGKTVTLKTIGLIALMAQSGLHIPAQPGSKISVFQNILADIGDEQSIEQSLSTFSGHITNIIRILENADHHSLVILDELGAGTDPQEGAALARALLQILLNRKITTLVTTHHPELKAFAHATPGVTNASVEFNLDTLRPTYKLIIGLPGRSNALAIAQRLGMPDSIIELARSELDPQENQAGNLLEEIHRQRELSQQLRNEAETIRNESKKIQQQLLERLENINDERLQILEEAHIDAHNQLNEAMEKLKSIRSYLGNPHQSVEELTAIQTEITEIKKDINQARKKSPTLVKTDPLMRPIEIGDKVQLRSMKSKGIVTSLDRGELEIQVGNIRLRANMDEVLHIVDKHPPSQIDNTASVKLPKEPISPGWELDLRGQHADDALHKLEQYLDNAYLAGLPFVRIIHGKGTGKLREAIRNYMNNYPQVSSLESGSEKEGGDGVTIAKLSSR